MSITLRTLGVLSVAALLAACGATPVERAATGGVLGAAAAAATDNDLADGALLGATAGIVSCAVAPAAPNCY
jgi:hypothetical protein